MTSWSSSIKIWILQGNYETGALLLVEGRPGRMDMMNIVPDSDTRVLLTSSFIKNTFLLL